MNMAFHAGRLQPALQYGSKSIVKVKALAEIGLRDLSDKWVDQLRFMLGKHLHKTLDSFDRTVGKVQRPILIINLTPMLTLTLTYHHIIITLINHHILTVFSATYYSPPFTRTS